MTVGVRTAFSHLAPNSLANDSGAFIKEHSRKIDFVDSDHNEKEHKRFAKYIYWMNICLYDTEGAEKQSLASWSQL